MTIEEKISSLTCDTSSIASAICVDVITVDADSSHIFSTLCASSRMI